MEYITVGKIEIPKLGIGSWDGIWGRQDRPAYDPERDQKTSAAIKEAVKLGITHIDTAEMYGNGYAEEVIGKVIEGMDRDSLFITTKVSGSNLDYNAVLESMNNSLKRLRTDHVDLYLVHWPSKEVPISETMRAMDELIDQGKTRYIGLSNFSLAQMLEAQNHSKHGIAAVQVEYNLVRRDNGRHSKNVESEVIPYCHQNDILVIAYKPFAGGDLSKGGILDELAVKYGKTPAQINLNWLMSKNLVTIVGSTNLSHIRDNLGALGWKMAAEDLKRLDSAREIK